jgi:hypothetical protein
MSWSMFPRLALCICQVNGMRSDDVAYSVFPLAVWPAFTTSASIRGGRGDGTNRLRICHAPDEDMIMSANSPCLVLTP